MLSTCFSLRAARRLSGSPAVGGCHAADMRHAPWDTRATDPCVRSSVSRVTSHWHGEVNPVRTSEVPVLEFAPFIYINIHWSSRSMARLLPLALALCGSAFCATPELEAPAYSNAHNAHSEQLVSAVTWLPEHATCYWASKPKTSTCVLDAVCSRADSAARARSHDATGTPDAFGDSCD